MNSLYKKIVPVTELRRNFGEIAANLATVDSLVLTKGGKPFAILKAIPEEKAKILKKVAGAWKGSGLDNDRIWSEVFKRRSRKPPVGL